MALRPRSSPGAPIGVAAAAKCCLGVALLSLVLPVAALGADLVVATASEDVNGDVSSPARLEANPGPDGISLREAILAVNAVAGPHTIRFADALAGATIALKSSLPRLERDGTALAGLTDSTGNPAPTLDASGIDPCCGVGALTIAASGVTVRQLRFTGVQPSNRAILIYAGAPPGSPPTPQVLRDLGIQDCVFDNEGFEPRGYAITLGMNHDVQDAVVRNFWIAGNTFRHFQGDATTVHLQAGGDRGLIENVAIHDNLFVECMFAVELVNVKGSGNTIRGTRVVRNVFEGGLEGAVTLLNQGRPDAPAASGNLVTQTLISENRFLSNRRWNIQMNGGSDNAAENAITDTWIANNLITRTAVTGGGIVVLGGGVGGVGNRVEGVHVLHNTIADNQNVGVAMVQNPGGSGNTVAGLDIRNNIFWMNAGDFANEIVPQQVRYCLTAQAGFKGVNGNVSGDPRLSAPSALDFHLRSGSPAIDAGTSDGSPSTDIECRVRFDDAATPNKGAGEFPYYDMGAFEYGSPPANCERPLRSARRSPPRVIGFRPSP